MSVVVSSKIEDQGSKGEGRNPAMCIVVFLFYSVLLHYSLFWFWRFLCRSRIRSKSVPVHRLCDSGWYLKVILELNFICIMLFNGDISWSVRSKLKVAPSELWDLLSNYKILMYYLKWLLITTSSILCTKYCTLVPPSRGDCQIPNYRFMFSNCLLIGKPKNMPFT